MKMTIKNSIKIHISIIIALIIGIPFCVYISQSSTVDNLINQWLNNIIWGENENIKIEDTPGTEEIIIEYSSGDVIEFPEDPRAILTYWLEYGEGGKDYIVASPSNQPEMNSKYGAENNDKMHKYLYQNRLNFDIPDVTRKGYIMFITTYPVNKKSNIFVGIDGSTIGWLDRDSTLYTVDKNEFLFNLNSINLIGNNDYHFSKDLSGKSTISINAVVGEAGNYVEKIIIFFK